MRKSGFTLIELLVYMAILGFIIVVAGQVFSDSTIMRVRSHNMIKTAESLGKVSNLIREDISQMGVKVGGESAIAITDIYEISVADASVYWNASGNDSSSYTLVRRKSANNDSTFFDSLVFRKAAFDDAGRYLGVREISWAAREGSRELYRRCATVSRPSGAPTDNDLSVCPAANGVNSVEPVLIADSILNFKITPSTPGRENIVKQDTLFPQTSANANFTLVARPSDGNVISASPSQISGTEVAITSFALNSNNTAKTHNELYLAGPGTTDWQSCFKIDLYKGETYAVEFEMPFIIAATTADSQSVFNSTQFQPGKDHIAVGFRKDGKEDASVSNDVLFYPPQDGAATSLVRHAEFSSKDDISDACVALTFAFYSPKAFAGKLRISKFKVYRKPDETFHFPQDEIYGTEAMTPIAERIRQKTNAKAFELVMEFQHRGEKAGTFSSDKKGMTITTPNNGVTVKP